MKLALVNPNTSATITQAMVRIAVETAGPKVTVSGHTAQFGAALIIEPKALAVAASAVAALAPTISNADAVVVAGFGDPGLLALRMALHVPVTGIAEASMAEAAQDGRRFAVVTTTPDLRARIAETAAMYGHRRFAGTWTPPGDPAALTANPSALQAALADAVHAAIHEGNVEAVVIGGGPLAGAAKALAATSPVPIIEPVPAAVRLSLERAIARART